MKVYDPKVMVLVALQVAFAAYLLSKVTDLDNEVAFRFKEAIQEKLPRVPSSEKEMLLDAWSSTYIMVVVTIGIYSLILTTMSIASMFIGFDKMSVYIGSSPEENKSNIK